MHTANLWTTYDLPWWKLQIGGGLNVVSSRFAASNPATVGGVAFLREASIADICFGSEGPLRLPSLGTPPSPDAEA